MLNVIKNKKFQWWLTAGILSAVVLTLAFSGFSSSNASASTSTPEAVVVSMDLSETVEASGALQAQPFASLTWKTNGVVETVNVKPGDTVKAGDILLSLQPESTSASIVSAQSDLVKAQKELDDVLNSNTNTAQAAIDLKNAKEAYDDAARYLRYLQNEKKIPMTDAKVYLIKTPGGWQYDYSHLKNYKGPATPDMLADAENDLDLKKAELDDAQRTYDWYKDGPNEQDIIAAQAKVDAAKATVNSLSIVAPFTGQVLSINDHRGDSVTTGQLSVNMADLRHLYVETQVDESDIAKVKVGNQAQVTLDALPGVKLSGKVTEINPVGEEVSGLVKFTVRVDLDIVKDQSFLPLGTTANVTIEVKEATATLAVPIAAIQNDAKGEYVLVLKNDGTQARMDVVTGTIIGNNVVISGDLQEGDVLNTSRESSFKAPNPFGGGK